MKKIIKLTTVLSLLFLLNVQSVYAAIDDEVTIEDENFLACLNENLAKQEDSKVTEGDLSSLTSLDCSRTEITSLSGAEYLTNLSSAFLDGNSISNLAPLASLENLQFLNLSDNSIENIESLGNLSNLVSLYLDNNDISDLTPLSNLDDLETIALLSNNVSNTAPIKNLPKLTTLLLANNEISDLKPISEISTLNSLNIGSNKFSDFSVLTKLENLNTLYLINSNIEDITPLGQITTLTSLNISSNNVSNLSPLKTLSELRALDVSDNKVKNFEAIKDLKNISFLSFFNNEVDDISAISNYTNVTFLGAGNNKIKDITPLKNFEKLSTLTLQDNMISDVSALENLNTLIILLLNDNQITDISPLVNNTSFIQLGVSSQNIVLDEISTTETSYKLPVDIYDLDKNIVPFDSPNEYSVNESTNKVISNTWNKTFKVGAREFEYSGQVSQRINNTKPTLNIVANDITVEQGLVLSDKEIVTMAEAMVQDTNGNTLSHEVVVIEKGNLDFKTEGSYNVTLGVDKIDATELSKEITINVVQEDNNNISSNNDVDEMDADDILVNTGSTNYFGLVILFLLTITLLKKYIFKKI